MLHGGDGDVRAQLRSALVWYFDNVYARTEGPGTLPYYCDPGIVGHFAVKPTQLAAGSPAALFNLFVAMAMFQARRDVVIKRQQASMSDDEAGYLVSIRVIARLAQRSRCDQLESAATFDAGCSVHKLGGIVDCARHPGAPCHVKDSTVLLRRMGDLGKLPTSAWLHSFRGGRLAKLLRQVQACTTEPQRRADLLVEQFTQIHRVGVKLATMFVSALSTPTLAPGLTPWFPTVDGNALVIVDTNVARAVDDLRGPGAPATYASRARWLSEQAKSIDLREFRRDLPCYSPRLVQQALYAFCSKSNRVAQNLACQSGATPCRACVPMLCPFMTKAARAPTVRAG